MNDPLRPPETDEEPWTPYEQLPARRDFALLLGASGVIALVGIVVIALVRR